MSVLGLLANPLTRKALPVIGEVIDAFTVPGEFNESELDKLIAKVRHVLPSVVKMRSLSVANATAADISDILAGFKVQLRPEDVGYWLDEFQAFSTNSDETIHQFVTGQSGRNMMADLVKRSINGAKPLNDEIPTYDPDSGTYIF